MSYCTKYQFLLKVQCVVIFHWKSVNQKGAEKDKVKSSKLYIGLVCSFSLLNTAREHDDCEIMMLASLV